MSQITVENLSKKFQIGHKNKASPIQGFFQSLSGREPQKTFWALKDISFEIKKGEIVGIIGKNGSGKTTLLRVLSKVYQKDAGSVQSTGNIISILGLSHGLKDRLTMRDNIYLCCAYFGLSRNEITQKFDAIVNFTELREYVDTKIYQFSTGMLARLVFAMAINCNADIILLDEVTPNIDLEFETIVTKTVKEMAQQGITFLLVSHSKDVIAQCDQVIWLDKGVVKDIGPANAIIPQYFHSS